MLSDSQQEARRMNGLGERRFSGTLTDGFDLWRLARPSMSELHEVVRGVVTAFTERRHGLLRALDIGMGDGSITGLLLADDKLTVTGVDNEPEMIERARERLAEPLAGGRLEIVLDDALHYLAAVPSGAFDLIASGSALHNMTVDHRARVEDEIWRVLAPSGLFVNADKYAQAGEAHHRDLRHQVNLFFDVLLPREKYDLLRQWVLHYVEDEAPDRLMPEAATVERLSELGFADLEIAERCYMDAVLVAHKP